MNKSKNLNLEVQVKKIINILDEYNTMTALNFFLDNINNKFLTLKTEHPKGFKNNRKINNSITFSFNDNIFEIYIVDMQVKSTVGGNKVYLGNFLLFFSKVLVLEVSVAENKNTSGKIQILWDVNNLKHAKLSSWVELLPDIVLREKRELAVHLKKLSDNEEKKITEIIMKKFDLGTYE